MKLGVYGGTFDPPHLAHLIVAQEAVDQLGLDRIIFMPTGVPPLKSSAAASAPDRARMVARAIEDNPAFELSTIEVDRPGVSYTADTLRQLRGRYGQACELYFVTGTDQVRQLRAWRDPAEVLRLARFAVVGRPGYDAPVELLDAILPGASARAVALNVPQVEISASAIRARVAAGRSIRYLVPDAVSELIVAKGLYRAADG